jgi:hypothetical protein
LRRRFEGRQRQELLRLRHLRGEVPELAVDAGRLVHRALRPYTPAEIALALESRADFGVHEELISTTVELAERKASEEGISYDLMECVALEAEETLKEIDVDKLPDLRGLKRASKFAGVLVGLGLVLCLIPGLMMPAFYLRAFTPWLNWARPSRTQISVLTGNRTVAKRLHQTLMTITPGELAQALLLIQA